MTNKALISILITLFFGAGAYAQQTDPWQKFKSDEGKFSVLFPCTPTVSSEDVKSGAEIVKQAYHSCSYGTIFYLVSYADFRVVTDAKAMLDKFRDGVAEGVKGALVSEEVISLSSYPGRSFSTKINSEGNEFVFTWRIYLVGGRIYGMGAGAKSGDAASPDGVKFLSSFALEK